MKTVFSILDRDKSAVKRLGYGFDDRGIVARFPAGTGYSSLHRSVQAGSEAYGASYPTGTWGSFSWSKAAEA
jgi:hypothetical protein